MTLKHIRKVLRRAFVLENATGVSKKQRKGSSVKFIDAVMQELNTQVGSLV